MKILLLLRALLNNKRLYHWNFTLPKNIDLVVQNLKDIDKLVLGQHLEVTSVNRQTGKITVKDPTAD